MNKALSAIPVAIIAILAACGGNVVVDGGTTSSSATGGSTANSSGVGGGMQFGSSSTSSASSASSASSGTTCPGMMQLPCSGAPPCTCKDGTHAPTDCPFGYIDCQAGCCGHGGPE